MVHRNLIGQFEGEDTMSGGQLEGFPQYQENILLNEMWLPSRVELHAASLTQHFLNMKVLHFILENEWGYLSKKYSIWAEE